jgi:hypothetical protein
MYTAVNLETCLLLSVRRLILEIVMLEVMHADSAKWLDASEWRICTEIEEVYRGLREAFLPQFKIISWRCEVMFIVTHLNCLHTPRSLGMVQSQLFGKRIEIRNVMKNKDDVKCSNKFSQYFSQNYFLVSHYFKIVMAWRVLHLLCLPRGSMAQVGLGFQYEIPRSHSDTPHLVWLPERATGPSQSPLTGNTKHSQETGTQATGEIRGRHAN